MNPEQAVAKYLEEHPESQLMEELLNIPPNHTDKIRNKQAEIKAVRKVCNELKALIGIVKKYQPKVNEKEEQNKKLSLDIQRIREVEDRTKNININQ